MSQASEKRNIGELYTEKCDFQSGIEFLEEAADLYQQAGEFSEYLSTLRLLLRVYAEQDRTDKINSTKERLQDVVLKEGHELNSHTYHTLGICAAHKKQDEIAFNYFKKALELALAKDSKEDMARAIYGLAQSYHAQGKYEEALKEIYNLEVFFEVIDKPQLKLSTTILNGYIHLKLGRQTQALDVFWKAYEMLKEQKNLYMYLHILYAIGITYQSKGDGSMARVYLELAQRTIDPNNLKVLAQNIDNRLEELGVKKYEEYDLIVKASSNSVVERNKGEIDFRNQFILLDLLHLLAKEPGMVRSKEDIVENVWSQKYDPSVHDNKIYVTIKRLRRLIEPDYEKPKYLFRAKNGYYINKSVKVLYDA